MGVVGVRQGLSVVAVLTRAYRQAVRDRRTVVGSALVLRFGVVRVPELHRLPSPGSRAWRHAHDLVDGDPPQQQSRLFPAFDDQVRLFADGQAPASYRSSQVAIPTSRSDRGTATLSPCIHTERPPTP